MTLDQLLLLYYSNDENHEEYILNLVGMPDKSTKKAQTQVTAPSNAGATMTVPTQSLEAHAMGIAGDADGNTRREEDTVLLSAV